MNNENMHGAVGARWTLAPLAAAVLAMAACGGSGGGDAPAGPSSSTLSMGGTAATGAAISGGAVEVNCASGTGAGTTTASGVYHVDITNGVLPCVLRVTQGGTVLHTVIAAPTGTPTTSGPYVANITPLSELVTAQLAGGPPANFFSNFNGAAQQQVTAATVNTAVAATRTALGGVVDLTGVNPLTDPLVAATGGTQGNALDQILDAVGAALTASGTTLAELTVAVSTPPTSTTPVAPAGWLLRPGAATCLGLKSGTYRAINPHEVLADPASISHLVTVDAQALTITDTSPGATPLALVPGQTEGCQFAMTEGDTTRTLTVDKSGLILLSGTGQPASFLMPEVTVTLAQLSGKWNYLSPGRTANMQANPYMGTVELDSAGHVLAATECAAPSDTACPAGDPIGATTVTALDGGGYSFTFDGDQPEDGAMRLYPFVAPNGALSAFAILPNDDGIEFWAKQTPLVLPVVDAVTSFYDLGITTRPSLGVGLFQTSSLVNSTVTVLTVDPAAQRYTRRLTSNGRIDGFAINSPEPGLRFRTAGDMMNSTGQTLTWGASLTMPLPGTGTVVYAGLNPAGTVKSFGISINKY